MNLIGMEFKYFPNSMNTQGFKINSEISKKCSGFLQQALLAKILGVFNHFYY